MPDVLPSSPTGDVYSKQLNVLPLKIGFLGLGTIGSAIVGNLLKTGHEVTVWNRTMSKVLLNFIQSRN
jgi:6-phosphogluconate dehydrogenase